MTRITESECEFVMRRVIHAGLAAALAERLDA
jgi:hypothetical protein